VKFDKEKAKDFIMRAAMEGNECAAAECFLKGWELEDSAGIKDMEQCVKTLDDCSQRSHPHGIYRFAEVYSITMKDNRDSFK